MHPRYFVKKYRLSFAIKGKLADNNYIIFKILFNIKFKKKPLNLLFSFNIQLHLILTYLRIGTPGAPHRKAFVSSLHTAKSRNAIFKGKFCLH